MTLEQLAIRWAAAIDEKRRLQKLRDENFLARERAAIRGEPTGPWCIGENEHQAVVCAAARQSAATRALLKAAREAKG